MRVNTSRNGAIELFRFLLACAIVGLHMSGYYAEPGHYFHGGYIAVDCFFVLSGLLVMVSYRHSIQTDPDATPSRRLIQILGKKWRSIYPTYIVSFAILFGFMEAIVYRNGPIGMLSGLAAALGEVLGVDIFGLGGGPATGGYLYYNIPAWYFSTMFAGLVLVLYIAIKLDENAYSLVFPGISVILYGYLHLKVGHLQIFEILGDRWPYPVWRAAAGLCLGAFSSLLYHRLSAVHLRSEGKMLRSAIELLLAGEILGYIYRPWAQYGVVDFSIPFLMCSSFPVAAQSSGRKYGTSQDRMPFGLDQYAFMAQSLFCYTDFSNVSIQGKCMGGLFFNPVNLRCCGCSCAVAQRYSGESLKDLSS